MANIFGGFGSGNKKADTSKKPKTKGDSTGIARGVTSGQFAETGEYNTDLVDRSGFEAYKKMLYGDGLCGAIHAAWSLPILNAQWTVEGGDDGLAEFASAQIMSNFQNHLQQVTYYLPYGAQAFERVYDVIDGQTVETGCYVRPPWTWYGECRNGQDEFVGIEQEFGGEEGFIPRNRLMLFVNQPDGETITGRAMFRPMYKHWYFKENIYIWDGIGIERAGTGTPYAITKSTKATVRDDIASALSNIRTSEDAYLIVDADGLASPDDIGMDPLGVIFNDYKNDAAMNSANMHAQSMASAALTPWLMLGAGVTGSYNLGESQLNFFELGLNASADYIAEVETEQRIKPLIDLNFDNVQEYPRLVWRDMRPPSPQAFAEYVQKVGGHLTPSLETENAIRNKGDLPPLDSSDTEGRTAKKQDKENAETAKTDDGINELQEHTPAARVFKRELSALESFVALQSIEQKMDDRKAMVTSSIETAQRQQVESLIDQIKPILESGEVDKLKLLRPSKFAEYQNAILEHFDDDFGAGANEVSNELDRQAQGVDVVERVVNERVQLQEPLYKLADISRTPEIVAARAAIEPLITTTAQAFAEDISAVTLRDMRARAAALSRDTTLDIAEKSALIKVAGETAGKRIVSSASSFAANNPVQFGREAGAQAESRRIVSGEYSALLDKNTCEECAQVDGTRITLQNPTPAAPNPLCFGSPEQCRCIHVWQLNTEIAG